MLNFGDRTKYIDRIGIELEGGFSDYKSDIEESLEEFEGAEIKEDGSLEGFSDYAWEITSPAYKLNHPDFPRFIKRFTPEEVNRSCGLHIHISLLNTRDLIKLACSDFHKYFWTEVRKWGRDNLTEDSDFFQRLHSKNEYCRKEDYKAMDVLLDPTNRTGWSRRVQLNFSAYHKHKTLECRLHAGYDEYEIVKSAVLNFVNIVETWLSTTKDEDIETLTVISDVSTENIIFSEIAHEAINTETTEVLV